MLHINFEEKAVYAKATHRSFPFSSQAELLALLETHTTKQGATDLWNALAVSLGGAPVNGCIRNKPAAAEKIWRAVQTIKPKEPTERAETVLDAVQRMISRTTGASIREMMVEMGWDSEHTVRGRISILRSSKGVAVESFRDPNRGRVYRTA